MSLVNDVGEPAGIWLSRIVWTRQTWRTPDQTGTCKFTRNSLMHQPYHVLTTCQGSVKKTLGQDPLQCPACESALVIRKHGIQVCSSPWNSKEVAKIHYAMYLQNNAPVMRRPEMLVELSVLTCVPSDDATLSTDCSQDSI